LIIALFILATYVPPPKSSLANSTIKENSAYDNSCMNFAEMAAQFFNRVGQIGLGVALVGGVVNSALYNGKGPM
jgi:hypothetical protein